jgi:hypothetical protein
MPNEIGRQFGQSIVLTLRPTVFDLNVLVLYVAHFGKTVAECRHPIRELGRRSRIEKSDNRRRRLLRSGRKR